MADTGRRFGMAGFVKGDVVIIPFPFSDLSGNKRRPALVLANLPGEDIILCQITSRQSRDTYTVPVDFADFENGSLPVSSNIRPSRIFTADKNIVIRKAGNLKTTVFNQVVEILIKILKR